MNQPKYAIDRLDAIISANDKLEKEELEKTKNEK